MAPLPPNSIPYTPTHKHRGRVQWTRGWQGGCKRPTPYTLNPSPFTSHPSPYTLRPTHNTLHPAHHTLHPTPYTLYEQGAVDPGVAGRVEALLALLEATTFNQCVVLPHPTPCTRHPSECTLASHLATCIHCWRPPPSTSAWSSALPTPTPGTLHPNSSTRIP